MGYWILAILILYSLACVLLYFTQEQFVFYPKRLSLGYQFPREQTFEETHIQTPDGVLLHGILAKADNSKGLIFYLHGRGSNISSYLKHIQVYNNLNYDVFLLDYRGFGKSQGRIKNKKQFFDDVRCAYSYVKKFYAEKDIVILGSSLGAAPAAKLASENKPRLLILEGGYYNPFRSAQRRILVLPVSIILKYRFETYKYVSDTDVQIVIFHGTKDKLVHYSNAIKMKKHLKTGDEVILLEDQGHCDFLNCKQYIYSLKKLLD